MSRTSVFSRLDETIALLRKGYEFIPELRRKNSTHIVETKLFGEPVRCIYGSEATRLFYDSTRFRREGAAPSFVQKTLTGENGVQALDNHAHLERKKVFMDLMAPERIGQLVDGFERAWNHALPRWEQTRRIVLFDETAGLLSQAVCEWSGIPLPDDEAASLAKDLVAMIDGFGSAGPRNLMGRRARRRCEAWAQSLIEAVRAEDFAPGPGTALRVFATRRNAADEPLPTHVAAVELLNVIRPVVAIAYFIAYIALALRRHPEWRQRLRHADDDEATWFVHEIRRYYPLTPFLGARVRQAFDWRGHHFPKDSLVLLDVYGAHHDDSLWPEADTFDPYRFRDRPPGEFDFIPQGGGDHYQDHRCAGEWITIALMRSAARLLVGSVEYTMPRQDLTVDLGRIPTRPRSGIVLTGIWRPTAANHALIQS